MNPVLHKYEPLYTMVSSSVADPVHFFGIRIRGSGFKNLDSDPGDPKRPDPTGSGSGSYLDMLMNKSFFRHFHTANLNILRQLKSQIKKLY